MSDQSTGSLSAKELLKKADVPDEAATIFVRHMGEKEPAGKGADIKAIHIDSDGGAVRVQSKHPRNWLIDWKGVLAELGLVAGGVYETPTAVGVALGALQALRVLCDKATITLGDGDARAVVEIWRDKKADSPIPEEDLRQALGLTPEAYESVILRLMTLGVVSRRDSDGRLVRTERIYIG